MLSKNIEGIPEFFRRINNWIELDRPSVNEKRALCIHRGITNNGLIEQISNNIKYNTLSDVDNLLINLSILINRKIELNKKANISQI